MLRVYTYACTVIDVCDVWDFAFQFLGRLAGREAVSLDGWLSVRLSPWIQYGGRLSAWMVGLWSGRQLGCLVGWSGWS